MSENVTEDILREAELRRLNAQVERDNAERSRIEKEESEISKRLGQRWWHMRLAVLLQVLIAGIVAGALIGGFLLDHFLKVSNLIQKQQTALEKESNDNLKRLKEERAENQLQLFELNNKLASLGESNDELKLQLATVEAKRARELENLQAIVKEKEAQLAQAELTSDQLREVKAAKEKAESGIKELSNELARLTEASKAAETRSFEISTQRISNTLRKYTWKMNYGDPNRTDYHYRFYAQGKIRFKTIDQSSDWLERSGVWRIDGDTLIIEGERVGNPHTIFPLSGVLPDMTHIKGQTEFRGKTYESSLERVRTSDRGA